jgi:hypothetical protein
MKLCDDCESRQALLDLCRKLPEEDCYRGEEKPAPEPAECDEYEFDCGNGQCIPGLRVCDYKYDCYNGADELAW